MHNEDKRQLIHLSMVGFALLFRWLTPWQALGCALLALLFNLFLVRKLMPEIYRISEHKKGYSLGINIYPLVILILIFVFGIVIKGNMYIVAGAWAILAFGDSWSNIIGRRVGKRKLYWNPTKSYVGLVAFILSSIIGSGFFLWWVKPMISTRELVNLAVSGSVICGILETLPIKIDDNILVGLGAGITLFLLSLAY